MTKVAVFVEGKTDRRFTRKLIGHLCKGTPVIIDEISLRGKESFIRLEQGKEPYVCYNFVIIEVPSLERLISAILDNAKSMVHQGGFSLLLGLRDLSPYRRSQKKEVLNAIASALARVPERERITIVLAVMEIEAWFLCDWHLFERIDSRLTTKYIGDRLNIDLVNDDPELTYNKPSKTMDDIFQLVGRRYRKHGAEIETVVRNIDCNYLSSCRNKVDSFFRFIYELNRQVAQAQDTSHTKQHDA